MEQQSPKLNDYNLNHPDIVAAKKLECYYSLFEIFKIRDSQTITLILSAGKTIAENFGTFTYFDLDGLLGYMKKGTRQQVINYLRKSKWIEYNGVDLEMSDRVRSLIHFLFTSLPRGEMSFAQALRLDTAEAELTALYNLEDDEAENYYFGRLVSGLKKKCSEMERIIQKRDRRQIWRVVKEGPDIIAEVRKLQKALRKRGFSLFSDIIQQQEVHDLSSKIISLVTQIGEISAEFINENAKAIGEFITPDMLDDYLRNADIEILARLVLSVFASPKIAYQQREETIAAKTISFFEDLDEEDIKVTPPPEVVEYSCEEYIAERGVNPLEILYQELLVRIIDNELSLDCLLRSAESFGWAMYRTGLIIKLCLDLGDNPREEVFSFEVIGDIKELPDGPIAKISATTIRRIKGVVLDGSQS